MAQALRTSLGVSPIELPSFAPPELKCPPLIIDYVICSLLCQGILVLSTLNYQLHKSMSFLNNRMGRGVVGPAGIWGRVQGVGSEHWGTRSQPWAELHPRAARTRAKRAFKLSCNK